jgi:Protein of unknown function (DUF742)
MTSSPCAPTTARRSAGTNVGVVRVLLDDLVQENLIEVMESAPRGGAVTDQRLLSKVLEGLRAL